jgi:IclR family acetate operon transcriptional repressor
MYGTFESEMKQEHRQGGRKKPSAERNGVPRVRAVYRVISILETLRDLPDGVGLASIAAAVDLPKSSTLRYLTTLESRRYVDRDEATGRYRLGLAFLQIQQDFRDALAARVRPYLERARDRFDETINFGLLDGNSIVYVEIVESSRSLRLAARTGDRAPIHSTAMGKAIAARMPDDQVRRILAVEGMEKRTEKTITSPAEFLTEIAKVRSRGYAVDHGEDEDGSRCVAVALPVDDVAASLSLSAPAFRFAGEDADEVAEMLTGLARDLATEIWSAESAPAREQ